MKLVSIPANPVPDDVVTGMLKTPDGVIAALCALAAAARPQGHGLHVPGPRRIHREIFRDGARPARARLCGRDARLARAGAVRARAVAIRARAMSATSPSTTATSRPSCSEVVLPDCPPPLFRARPFDGRHGADPRRHQGSRWFDRMVLTAPMIAARRHARSAADGRRRAMRMLRHWARPLRAGRRRHVVAPRPFVGNR